jgi:hypothetical protein
MVGKFQIFIFQPNFNRSKILLIVPDMSQTIHEDLI